MNWRRRIPWVLVLVVDAGFIAWGFMAAAFPDYLLGPGGQPILLAGYEGYTGGSWLELVSSSPMVAGYIEILFRMYGVFNLIVGLMGVAIAATAFRRGDIGFTDIARALEISLERHKSQDVMSLDAVLDAVHREKQRATEIIDEIARVRVR